MVNAGETKTTNAYGRTHSASGFDCSIRALFWGTASGTSSDDELEVVICLYN